MMASSSSVQFIRLKSCSVSSVARTCHSIKAQGVGEGAALVREALLRQLRGADLSFKCHTDTAVVREVSAVGQACTQGV